MFSQAAEQAKASPALVAKDPSTSTNKKEEEDLAKGKEASSEQSNMSQCLMTEVVTEHFNLSDVTVDMELKSTHLVILLILY